MDIFWETVGIVAAIVFCGILLAKPLAYGIKALSALPKKALVPFLVLCIAAAVEADKTNSPPRMLVRIVTGGGSTVSSEDIARGYRLDHVTNDVSRPHAMPTNATYVGNAHVRGASSSFGRNLLDFSPWTFPFGTNGAVHSRFWWFVDGRLRLAPHDAGREIAAGRGDMLAVQGDSRIWWAEGEGDERIVGWENVHPNRDTNAVANLQIVLRPDGGFETWSNEVGSVYARIDRNDWDGDGLDNSIDPNPQSGDGDCFGTGVDWLNANCGNVLSASADTNGEIVVAWLTNANENAYCWLQFTATKDGTRTTVECDGESNLGDMFVIANSNQTCRVPILIGARYHVRASHPVADVSASDPSASISYMRSAGEFYVERPIALTLAESGPGGTLATVPDVGASISSITGNCCQVEVDGTNYAWACSGCSCSGYGQTWNVTAAWEGYVKTFSWYTQCSHQEYNGTHPQTWGWFSASPVVMRGGNMGGVSVTFDPPSSSGEASATLRIEGGDRVALWWTEGRTEAVSLPMTLSAWQPVSFCVEGLSVSESVGDVRFCLDIEDGEGTTNTVTHAVTVARVLRLDMSSSAAGESSNPPPFDGETACPFSVTNSPNADRHLLVPFCNVATLGANGFSVADFKVDMALVLTPSGIDTTALPCDWELFEANPQSSGSLVSDGGLVAEFRNPKQGGVYRFRARCDGSPWTEGNVVLPLSGAGVDAVLAADMVAVDATIGFITNRYTYLERQTISFGEEWFNDFGVGDYLGRVDSAAKPTVWVYNQVNDLSGMGAVATMCGIPVRMSKLSNFLVAYETKRVGVWGFLRWLARHHYGSGEDDAAGVSWAAGTDVAEGANFSAALLSMTANMWPVADEKERRLWPNDASTDNHVERSFYLDYNYNFVSPGFITRR